nr:unnamed protein product [Haemonchus contortus]
MTESCRPCPPGQYSLGGGSRFEEFYTLPPGFSVENFDANSVQFDDSTPAKMEPCPPETGWIVRDAELLYIPSPCISRLSLSAKLVRPGFVEFSYRMPKNNRALSLHVDVRNQQCQSYREAMQSMLTKYAGSAKAHRDESNGDWQKRTVDLRTGPKAEHCTERPACRPTDYYPVTEPCTNGTTRTTYKKVQPAVCRADVLGASPLPAPSATRACPPCNPGMAKDANGVCVFCPSNHYSQGDACIRCPVETVPIYGYEYVEWDTTPPNIVTRCEYISEEVNTMCDIGEAWLASGTALVSAPSLQRGIALEFELTITEESNGAHKIVTVSVPGGFQRQPATTCLAKKGLGEIAGSGNIKVAFLRSGATSGEDSILDQARILSINVTNIGSNGGVQGGGASRCLPCPKGQLGKCVPCPPGHYMTPKGRDVVTGAACRLTVLPDIEGMDEKSRPIDIHMWFDSVGATSEACPRGNALVVTARCMPSKKNPEIRLPHTCPDGTCDGCLFHAIVESVQACPVCEPGDYEMIRGECTNGQQTIHHIPDKHCVLTGKEALSRTVACSTLSEKEKLMLSTGVLAFIILCIALIIICQRNRKLEYKYTRLIESRNGELPAAETCGLEDDEDDEAADRVIFAKGRRKIFGGRDTEAFVPLENED